MDIDFTFDENGANTIDVVRRLCGDTFPVGYRVSDSLILASRQHNDFLTAARCREIIRSMYAVRAGWHLETERIRNQGLSDAHRRVQVV